MKGISKAEESEAPNVDFPLPEVPCESDEDDMSSQLTGDLTPQRTMTMMSVGGTHVGSFRYFA